MVDDFKKAFESFISERINEIEDKLIENNPEFIQLQEQFFELKDKLKECLGENDTLCLKMEDLHNQMNWCCNGIIYQQGLKDGIEIVKTVLGIPVVQQKD